MDAKDDLILGVVANYGIEWLEAYMVSTKRCGFRGHKVLMVWNIAEKVRTKLKEYGFELIDVPPANTSVDFCSNFFEYRDKLAYEFLRDRGNEFRFVFWMDIRDLVFQTDPSVWMENHLGDKKIVVGSECILIKSESCNDTWLKHVFDNETYVRIREHEVLNGGTFAGTSEAMTKVFKRLYEIAHGPHNIEYAPGIKEVSEQAALNVILRDEFSSITMVPRMREGFAAVGYGFGNQLQHVWTDQAPVLNRQDCMLYPAGSNTPFSIVHQYDRHKEWLPVIASIYKDGTTQALPTYPSPKDRTVSRLRRPPR